MYEAFVQVLYVVHVTFVAWWRGVPVSESRQDGVLSQRLVDDFVEAVSHPQEAPSKGSDFIRKYSVSCDYLGRFAQTGCAVFAELVFLENRDKVNVVGKTYFEGI